MNHKGLSRVELALSLTAPLALLAIAGSLGGLAPIVFLFGALGALGIAAAVFGADSRDGADWKEIAGSPPYTRGR